MLAFLVPVRHPDNAKDYAVIEEMLIETIRSLTGTRNAAYEVFVACNRVPEEFEHEHVHFIDTGFAPPGSGRASKQTFKDFWKDKSTKIAAALLHAKEAGADQFMVVDADDFVHRDLAAHCQENKELGSFWIEDGLNWRHGTLLVAARTNFSRYCGTSHIVSMEDAAKFLPDDLKKDASQEEIMEKLPKTFREEVLGNHQKVDEVLATVGGSIHKVPFPAAVWRNGSGESHSGARFRQPPRLAGKAEVEIFGLPIGHLGLGARLSALGLVPAIWVRNLGRLAKERAGLVPLEYAKRRGNKT